MNKETTEKLNNQAVNLLLENIIDNDNTFMPSKDPNREIIKTSIDYTLMITKATNDIADHAYIHKFADLYDETDDGEAEDYLITVYGKQLKNLGIDVED